MFFLLLLYGEEMKKITLLLVVLAGLIMPVFSQDGSAGGSFDALFPADTLVLIELHDTGVIKDKFNKTAFSKILNDKQTQLFLSHAKVKLDELMKFAGAMGGGVDAERVLGVLGKHVAVGVLPGQGFPQVMLVADFADDFDPVKDILSQRMPNMVVNGVFNMSMPLNPVMTLHINVTGKRLVLFLGSDEKVFKSVLAGNGSRLSQDAEYKAWAEKSGGNKVFSFFGRMKTMDYIPLPPEQMTLLKEQLAMYGLKGLSSAAYSIAIDGDGFVQRLYNKFEGKNPYSVGVGSKLSDDLRAYVPTKPVLYSSAFFDFTKSFDIIISSVQAAVKAEAKSEGKSEDDVKKEIAKFFDAAKKMTDVDLQKDLLPLLKGQGIVFIQTPEDLPGLNLIGLAGTTAVIKPADTAKLVQVFDKLIAFAAKRGANFNASEFSLKTDYAEIKGIALVNSLVVCYAVDGDKILMAANPYAIIRAFEAKAGKNNILADNSSEKILSEIKRVAGMSGITAAPSAYGYMEIDGISGLWNNLIGLGSTAGGVVYSYIKSEENHKNGVQNAPSMLPFPDPKSNPVEFVRYLSAAFPLYLLPSQHTFNKNLFDSWNSVFQPSESEQCMIIYGPLPMGNSLFSKFNSLLRDNTFMGNPAVVGIMAAMLSGPLMNARKAALNVATTNNLKQIGTAYMFYKQQNNHAPASLDELVKADLLSEKLLYSPIQGNDEIAFDLVPLKNGEEARGNVIIVIEKPGSPKGGTVLYGDGHVEVINAEPSEYAGFYNAVMNNMNRDVIELYAPNSSNAATK